LFEDQVKVEVLPSKTETGSADKLTVGSGVVGVVGVFPPPPPPPPPPQEVMTNMLKTKNTLFNIYVLI
jgi:hypothetical protein